MRTERGCARRYLRVVLGAVLAAMLSAPVVAAEYAALKDVKGLDTVFDFSQGNPKVSNIVFWAMRDLYTNDSVKGLAKAPRTVVVLHGPVVKLITSERKGFNAEESAEVDTLQQTIREMKNEGVTFEVCMYAAKVFGVEEATIIPEIDRVPNGFVSVAGYQAQGYSAIRVP